MRRLFCVQSTTKNLRMETLEEKLGYGNAGEFCLFDTGNTEAKTHGNIQPKTVHDEKKKISNA